MTRAPHSSGVEPSHGDSSSAAPQSALRSRRAWCLLLVTLACALLIDLVSKQWAFRTIAGAPVVLLREEIVDNTAYRLPFHEGWKVLPLDLLDFRLVLNHGAVFGIGDGQRLVFVGFTVVALAVGLFVFARWTRPRDWPAHIAIGLVLAGGLGNLYDRIVYGAVRDFLHMLPRWNLPFGFRWPGGNSEVFPWVFNVADVCLLAGMAILILFLQRSDASDGTTHEAREDRAKRAELTRSRT